MANMHMALLATTCALIFIGICVCFDRKRHKDPHFKKKLRLKREKRIAEKLKKIEQSKIPVPTDPKEMQRFLICEIQRAEDLMTSGRFDEAINHFATAINICAEPDGLLKALRLSLREEHFDDLLHVLDTTYGIKYHKSQLPKEPRLPYCPNGTKRNPRHF